MSDRIRIDRNEAMRAPAASAAPGMAQPQQSEGAVFGHVGTSTAGSGGGGIWARPKLLLAIAGSAAALISWAIVDGLFGFGRYEQAGEDVPVAVVLVLLPAFCALLAGCIASADDFASGSVARGTIFAGIGAIGGLLGGLVAHVVGGIVMSIILRVFIESSGAPDSRSELLLLAMIARVPAWTVAGALTGLVCGALGRSGRRALLGLAGGAAGGLIGGLVFDPVSFALTSEGDGGSAAVSRLLGLLSVGVVSGIGIAFAEDAAKSAWLVIERGRLIGKQFIIYRNPTRIGAAYSNDVFLFKDQLVQPEHAQIVKRGGQYAVEARGGALVRVNGKPVATARIVGNDVIQIGETVLRFMTRARGA